MNRCAGQERNGRGWYRRDQREQATAADRNCDGDRVAIGDLARLPAARSSDHVQVATSRRAHHSARARLALRRHEPDHREGRLLEHAPDSVGGEAASRCHRCLSTASQSEHVHHPLVGPHPGAPTPAIFRGCSAIGWAFSQEERIRVSTRWRSECRTRPMRCALRGGRAFELSVPPVISLYRPRYIEICCGWIHAAASKTTTDTTASFSRCPVAASSSLRRVRSHPTAVWTKTFWSST